MGVNGEPGPANRALSPEHQLKANALYWDLLALREQGIKFVMVHNEEELGLRVIGQRRKIRDTFTGLSLS